MSETTLYLLPEYAAPLRAHFGALGAYTSEGLDIVDGHGRLRGHWSDPKPDGTVVITVIYETDHRERGSEQVQIALPVAAFAARVSAPKPAAGGTGVRNLTVLNP